MRLGKKQLELMRGVGATAAFVVPNPTLRRLCDLGVMKAHGPDGSFVAITPDGLRALADAVEDGRIGLFTMPPKRSERPVAV